MSAYSTGQDINGGVYGQSNTEFYAKFNPQQPFNSNFGANGRVFFDINSSAPQYDLYKGSSRPSNDVSNNTLNYSLEETPLSRLYFSAENAESIQTELKKTVYELCQQDTDPILTPHKPIIIGRQSDLQLQIIMRSIYLQYAKNVDYNIAEQIRELNSLVIRECVPGIITNVKQYFGYTADAQRLPLPIDLPKNPSSRGEKTYNLLIV
jgi:hypothetical protein